jgi:hypothetical protein
MRVALLLPALAAADHSDLRRAKTKVPSDAFRGDGQVGLSKVLNGHLRNSEANLKSCEEWTTAGLQEFMGHIAPHRSSELMEIYEESNDKRAPVLKNFFDHMSHWKEVNRLAKHNPEFEEIARESHCRQAVMWWVHLLSNEKRAALRSQVTVPLLPEGEKKHCSGSDVCAVLAGTSTCDWCHSKEADRAAGIPGTSAPDAKDLPDGPDDGNPKGWDRTRRCDQNYVDEKGNRGCQPCEGIGGQAFGDKNEEINIPSCKVVAHAKSEKFLLPKPVKPIYPKKFTVKSDKSGGYGELDTLIGWQLPTDTACLAFFPQNDSSSYPLCYRDQSANLKVYDIENARGYFEYQIGPNEKLNLTNTTTHILHNSWQMWVMNWIPFNPDAPTAQCVCTNPSGQHCTDPPCYSYIFNYDTFESAEFVGRERIGVEWIEDAGAGESAKEMELDHWNLLPHHVWTDPRSGKIVRAWQPFNGLQVYNPDSWSYEIEDESVFEYPPAMCKAPPAGQNETVWRINCDDDGNFDGTPPPPEGLGHLISEQWKEMAEVYRGKSVFV